MDDDRLDDSPSAEALPTLVLFVFSFWPLARFESVACSTSSSYHILIWLYYIYPIRKMEADMNERTSQMPGISDYIVANRKCQNCFLDEIDRYIDWKPLESTLRQKHKIVADAVSNPAYLPLPMFKTLLLQRWYSLSDVAMEEALADRYSFFRFTGFALEDEAPDASMICRFRDS